MKLKQLFIVVFTLLQFPVFAGEIVLSGVYQGKNIYVQNPFSSDKKNFCTEEVFVNDIKKMDNIKSSAFEIDLSYLSMNDPVTIKIVYKDECMPKVLNSYVLRPSSTFQFVAFNIGSSEANWSTTGEKKEFVYYLEQFVNNNWLVVKSVKARGENGGGIYNLAIDHRFKTNKYRIKAQDQDSHQIYYSKAIDFTLGQEPITFYPKSVINKITLSREAQYKVLSAKGEVIKEGKGTEIPLADLKTGVYYLDINQKTEKFFKK
jgi:hypothetical protein